MSDSALPVDGTPQLPDYQGLTEEQLQHLEEQIRRFDESVGYSNEAGLSGSNDLGGSNDLSGPKNFDLEEIPNNNSFAQEPAGDASQVSMLDDNAALDLYNPLDFYNLLNNNLSIPEIPNGSATGSHQMPSSVLSLPPSSPGAIQDALDSPPQFYSLPHGAPKQTFPVQQTALQHAPVPQAPNPQVQAYDAPAQPVQPPVEKLSAAQRIEYDRALVSIRYGLQSPADEDRLKWYQHIDQIFFTSKITGTVLLAEHFINAYKLEASIVKHVASIFKLFSPEDWVAIHWELTCQRPHDEQYKYNEASLCPRDVKVIFDEELCNDKSLTFKGYISDFANFQKVELHWMELMSNVYGCEAKALCETWPTDPAQQQLLAKKLFEAIINLDDIVDKPKKATVDNSKKRKGNGGQAIPQVDPNEEKIENNTQVAGILSRSNIDLEMLAWQLLCWTRFAQSGYTGLLPYHKDFKLQEYPTFMERYEALLETVKRSKAAVFAMLEIDQIKRTAFHPEHVMKRIITNQQGNKRKQARLDGTLLEDQAAQADGESTVVINTPKRKRVAKGVAGHGKPSPVNGAGSSPAGVPSALSPASTPAGATPVLTKVVQAVKPVAKVAMPTPSPAARGNAPSLPFFASTPALASDTLGTVPTALAHLREDADVLDSEEEREMNDELLEDEVETTAPAPVASQPATTAAPILQVANGITLPGISLLPVAAPQIPEPAPEVVASGEADDDYLFCDGDHDEVVDDGDDDADIDSDVDAEGSPDADEDAGAALYAPAGARDVSVDNQHDDSNYKPNEWFNFDDESGDITTETPVVQDNSTADQPQTAVPSLTPPDSQEQIVAATLPPSHLITIEQVLPSVEGEDELGPRPRFTALPSPEEVQSTKSKNKIKKEMRDARAMKNISKATNEVIDLTTPSPGRVPQTPKEVSNKRKQSADSQSSQEESEMPAKKQKRLSPSWWYDPNNQFPPQSAPGDDDTPDDDYDHSGGGNANKAVPSQANGFQLDAQGHHHFQSFMTNMRARGYAGAAVPQNSTAGGATASLRTRRPPVRNSRPSSTRRTPARVARPPPPSQPAQPAPAPAHVVQGQLPQQNQYQVPPGAQAQYVNNQQPALGAQAQYGNNYQHAPGTQMYGYHQPMQYHAPPPGHQQMLGGYQQGYPQAYYAPVPPFPMQPQYLPPVNQQANAQNGYGNPQGYQQGFQQGFQQMAPTGVAAAHGNLNQALMQGADQDDLVDQDDEAEGSNAQLLPDQSHGNVGGDW